MPPSSPRQNAGWIVQKRHFAQREAAPGATVRFRMGGVNRPQRWTPPVQADDDIFFYDPDAERLVAWCVGRGAKWSRDQRAVELATEVQHWLRGRTIDPADLNIELTEAYQRLTPIEHQRMLDAFLAPSVTAWKVDIRVGVHRPLLEREVSRIIDQALIPWTDRASTEHVEVSDRALQLRVLFTGSGWPNTSALLRFALRRFRSRRLRSCY